MTDLFRTIWLDDVRPAPDGFTDIARNYSEFRLKLEEIKAAGDIIAGADLDYVLDDFPDPNWPRPYEKCGKHCAELLVHYHMAGDLPEDFEFDVHSSGDKFNADMIKTWNCR